MSEQLEGRTKPVNLYVEGFPIPPINIIFRATRIRYLREDIRTVDIDLTMEELLELQKRIDKIIRRLDVEKHK